MSYSVKQGDIFGRIGEQIGKGLADQVPKEVENYRLRKGLQQLGKEAPDLSPLEFATKAYGTYGITPQMVQSLGGLAQQESRNKAMMDYQNAQNKTQYIPPPPPESESASSKTPSVTKPGPLDYIQGEEYLPPTEDQIVGEGTTRFYKSPGRYNNNIENAIEEARRVATTNQSRFQAHQKQHADLQALQDNVVSRLRTHSSKLGVQVPENVYSSIEDEAIKSIKPKSQGGGGLTEQQAMKDYGKKLDEISREYAEIDPLVQGWAITGRGPKQTLNSLESLQKKFEKRNDSRNLADLLIKKGQVSPLYAYSFAQPVKKVPELNKAIKSTQNYNKIAPLFSFSKGEDLRNKTLEVSEKLAPLLRGNDKASPLAIGYELKKLNYDPEIWLDYLNRKQEDLGLSPLQIDQLGKPINFFNPWNDVWLSEWTGIE